MTIPDRTLRQFLADALDPPEQARVERALAANPALWARLVALRQATAAEPLGWFVPPPGARPAGPWPTLSGQAAPAAMMGGEGWLVLYLDVSPAHLDHRVVVLERHGADWTVRFPVSPEEEVTASALHREGDRVRLDYALDPSGGAGRLAVVLVPASVPVDWLGEPTARWAAVQDALAEGVLPAVAFDLGP